MRLIIRVLILVTALCIAHCQPDNAPESSKDTRDNPQPSEDNENELNNAPIRSEQKVTVRVTHNEEPDTVDPPSLVESAGTVEPSPSMEEWAEPVNEEPVNQEEVVTVNPPVHQDNVPYTTNPPSVTTKGW